MDMVGNTPMVRAKTPPDLSVEIYVKLEGTNPTGSLKDRAARSMILDKIEKGELKPGATLLDSSSGNHACAVAFFANLLGHPATVVTGETLTKDKAGFIDFFGAERLTNSTIKRTIDGNQYCREVLIPEDPDRYCFLDQLHNWANPEGHYCTTAPEIFRDLPDVAAVAFSLGSGGTLHGIGRYRTEYGHDTKVIAVTGGPGTKIPGTGPFVDGEYVTPFNIDCQKHGYLDCTTEISTEDAVDGMMTLRAQGFFVGLQTGGVYQGLLNGIRELGVEGPVAMLSGDSGWKNMDKLLTVI